MKNFGGFHFVTSKESELHYYSHFDGHFLDLQWCVQKKAVLLL
jgi:hypothetical protein